MKRNTEILLRLAQKNIIASNQIQQLEQEIQDTGQDIQKFLISQKICTEAQYFSVIADMFCVPFSRMAVLDVDKELLETFDFAFLKNPCPKLWSITLPSWR